MDKFEFEKHIDFDIEAAIHQAIGAASMCWEKPPEGVFDSDRAHEISLVLQEEILRQIQHRFANLWGDIQRAHSDLINFDEYLIKIRRDANEKLMVFYAQDH